jgi:hypothetical protein
MDRSKHFDPGEYILHRLRAKPVEYTVRIRHFVVTMDRIKL